MLADSVVIDSSVVWLVLLLAGIFALVYFAKRI